MWYHGIYREGNKFNKDLAANKPNYRKILDDIIKIAKVMKSWRESEITRKANYLIKKCNELKEKPRIYQDDVDKICNLMYDYANYYRIWIDCFDTEKDNY